ncbi:unnamed protein product [marine sediment metagenome]|uniref:Uncharacterized protein n=1 Tax=marine sediment metagenome TaxID=412755 RepID=X0WHD0_9ZZZZ
MTTFRENRIAWLDEQIAEIDKELTAIEAKYEGTPAYCSPEQYPEYYEFIVRVAKLESRRFALVGERKSS